MASWTRPPLTVSLVLSNVPSRWEPDEVVRFPLLADLSTMRRVILIFILLAIAGVASGLSQTPAPTPTAGETRADAIDRLYNEGLNLYAQGTSASLNTAIGKFLDAGDLARQAGLKYFETICLMMAGSSYNKLGDTTNALKYYLLADKSRPYGQTKLEADVLLNLGLIYNGIGEHGKALAIFRKEGELRKSLDDIPGQLAAMHNGAMILNELGDLQRAKDIYEQILAVEHASGDKRIEAASTNNLAYVYYRMLNYSKAAELYEQAYEIAVAAGFDEIQAAPQIGLGDAYRMMNQQIQAIDYYNHGLLLLRKTPNQVFEADAFYGLGMSYQVIGEKQRAREFFDKALNLQEALQAREQLSLTLAAEMSLWLELGQPNLAILYGKRAVNLTQAMRGMIENLSKDVQRLYLKTKESTYRDLSNILISEGRLPEAQGVLDLLKEQEYEQFSKLRSGESAGTVPYSRAEGDL